MQPALVHRRLLLRGDVGAVHVHEDVADHDRGELGERDISLRERMERASPFSPMVGLGLELSGMFFDAPETLGKKETGSSVAVPIFRKFVEDYYADKQI